VFLVLASLLHGGCGEGSSRPETRDQVAVFGYLYVGEPVHNANAIAVSRVRPIDQVYDFEEAAVRNAIVTLQREDDPPAPLQHLGGASPGHYANESITIEPGTTYRLRVEIPGDRVLTATTITPDSFTVAGGPPVGEVRHEILQEEYPMLVTAPDAKQIFLVDVYCLEEWQDAFYVNPFGDHDQPDDFDEYGGASGEPRHITAYFRLRNLVREEEGYRIDFYGAMMAFFGEYDVHVFSIDANYYNYLYRDYPEENGGIEGGIGVFASSCRRAWRVTVTR
jgi:hypothetical protein